MAEELPTKFLQENLLALLAHRDDPGKMVANMVTADLFEGDYREIAEAVLHYWKVHGKAPNIHTADLFDKIFADPKNPKAKTFDRILRQLFELNEHIQTSYVMNSVRLFVRNQKLKQTIIKSAERINADPEIAHRQIEEMWRELLATRDVVFEPGLKLSDFQTIIAYHRTHQTEFRTGVKALDDLYIVPARKEVYILISGPNRGKSWHLMEIGINAIRDRKKVLYFTGENSKENTGMRGLEKLFAVSKREETSDYTTFIRDEDNPNFLKGFKRARATPDFTFDDENIYDEMQAAVVDAEPHIDNMRIIEFPDGEFTIADMEVYLDQYEAIEGFVPDMVILDQLNNLKADPARLRLDMGMNLRKFRALCQRRNVAGVTVHQAQRISDSVDEVRRAMSSEDWSIVFTADTIITFSQSDGEEQLGLARLLVDKARNEKRMHRILIAQSYVTGQFSVDSIKYKQRYKAAIEELLQTENDDYEKHLDEDAA